MVAQWEWAILLLLVLALLIAELISIRRARDEATGAAQSSPPLPSPPPRNPER